MFKLNRKNKTIQTIALTVILSSSISRTSRYTALAMGLSTSSTPPPLVLSDAELTTLRSPNGESYNRTTNISAADDALLDGVDDDDSIGIYSLGDSSLSCSMSFNGLYLMDIGMLDGSQIFIGDVLFEFEQDDSSFLMMTVVDNMFSMDSPLEGERKLC